MRKLATLVLGLWCCGRGLSAYGPAAGVLIAGMFILLFFVLRRRRERRHREALEAEVMQMRREVTEFRGCAGVMHHYVHHQVQPVPQINGVPASVPAQPFLRDTYPGLQQQPPTEQQSWSEYFVETPRPWNEN